MRWIVWALCILVSTATLSACEDGALTTGDEQIDANSSDASASDADSGFVPTPDVSEPNEITQPDGQPSEDAALDEPCETGTGCFEDPCGEPEDCNSGICIQHMGEKVCSKTCSQDCPDGWTCDLVTTGADSQYVCTSSFADLCLPCATTEGCDGATGAACVSYADGTSFCGGACDVESPCPSGYSCQNVETTSGAKSFQCVADSGTCACSSTAIDRGASTPCSRENEHGVCHGLRVCDPSGLLECDAQVPGPEVCNGVDDDCDGTTDVDTCDDGNPCTTDPCSGEGGCVHEPIDGGECLDGDACTAADHCEEGVCVGMPVDCSDDNPCTLDSCDGAGGCLHEPQPSLCDDGDPCTIGDVCAEGTCAGSVTLECDDGNPCTDDTCSETGCVHAPNQDECDDGNACTESSVCSAGGCAPLTPVSCDDSNDCTTDSCDPIAGCVYSPNALPCEDGDVCTLGDACADNACQAGGAALTCDDGNPCTTDTCDVVLGCVFTPNSDACDDSNDCTVMDACLEGQCVGTGSVACDDGNPCTVDSCLTDGGCAHEASEGSCSDGDPCTLNDQCVEGQCVSGDALVCDDQNGCTDDSCDPEVGCVFTANEAECEDGNECTNLDMCWQGTCVAMGTIDCDDGNPCTADACKPLEGCVHTPIEVPCSDGDPCTTGDTCEAGACVGGAPLSCEDNNPCTSGSCVEGGCKFTPQAGDCDDSNACTVNDTCGPAGVCASDEPLPCDDDDVCTDDSCDPADGCVHAFNQSPCDDESACTSASECVEGACVGLESIECDDQNPCTTDGCDPDEGCEHEDNALECDDENECTTQSQCDLGDCVGDLDVDCDDGNACTADSCDPEDGCVNVPQPCCGDGVTDPGEECDDGNDNPDDSCNNSCISNGPSFHMNGSFYVSDDTYQGDFNAGGGFCTSMVGQTAYIAGNNASPPNPEPGGTWQGNGSSSHPSHNCHLYTTSGGEGYGTKGGYGSCSQFRHVVCSTDPAYCNGYGMEYCHLWD
ncbi:MAG: hypothetical protein CL940_07320 [Deltaproteobacteria bacterium]|nr:hypothetical protein [Deltaproteobacteria bacterium]